MTPNRLTMASAAVGWAAALSFALRAYVAGALLFQLAFLFDCMDGKLAEVREERSPWGAFFDQLGDAATFGPCIVALVATHMPDTRDQVLVAAAVAGLLTLRAAVAALIASLPPDLGQPPKVRAKPTLVSMLRIAPRRLARPGSTVDGEAVVLTLGPLTGHVTVGILTATAFAIVNFLWLASRGLREGRAPQPPATDRKV